MLDLCIQSTFSASKTQAIACERYYSEAISLIMRYFFWLTRILPYILGFAVKIIFTFGSRLFSSIVYIIAFPLYAIFGSSVMNLTMRPLSSPSSMYIVDAESNYFTTSLCISLNRLTSRFSPTTYTKLLLVSLDPGDIVFLLTLCFANIATFFSK